MSQERLAELTGLTRVHVNRIENGKHVPKPSTVALIAEALDCPAELLAADEDEEDSLNTDILRVLYAQLGAALGEKAA